MKSVNHASANDGQTSGSGRRRVVVVLFTAIGLLGIDLAVRQLHRQLALYEVGEYQRRPAALSASAMPDIVLMGSSRAKYALVPRVFESVTGGHAYNCAISGSKIVEWVTVARRVFADQQPRVVVLGVNASELRADYSPSEAARNLFEWPDFVESCQIDGLQSDVIGGYLRSTVGREWALFDQRYALKMWGQEQLAFVVPKHAQQSRELRERAARPTPPDGYYHPWAFGRQLQSLEMKLLKNVVEVEAARPPEYSDDSPTFTRLAQLLDMFSERKIQTVVAYLPNSPRTEGRWRQVEPHMIARISEICRACGADFLSCGETEVQRTNSDFMEEIHMGLPLAERISRRVAQRIVQLGLLPGESTQMARQTPLD